MTKPNRLPNTGHGHVFPRPDGVKARCGGPVICQECARDAAEKNRELTAMIQGVGRYRHIDNETVLEAIKNL